MRDSSMPAGRAESPPMSIGEVIDAAIQQRNVDQAENEVDLGFILWKHNVKQCATSMSNKVLEKYNGADCPDVPIADLAAALWLKEWLGETDWDGSGRPGGNKAG